MNLERIDITLDPQSGTYTLLEPIIYYSARYDKLLSIPTGFRSDGATDAMSLISLSWLVHDALHRIGHWTDGCPVTIWQATMVLHDILAAEGHTIRAVTWPLATFITAPVWW